MSEYTDSSKWLRNTMAGRLDEGSSNFDNERKETSTAGRISQDSHEHILHFSNPPALPASAENAPLADVPLSSVEASANEKGRLHQDRMTEGHNNVIYPSTPILVTLTTALMTAVFMIGLDTNIIGESIHSAKFQEPRGIPTAASYPKENTEPMATTRNRHPKNHDPLP